MNYLVKYEAFNKDGKLIGRGTAKIISSSELGVTVKLFEHITEKRPEVERIKIIEKSIDREILEFLKGFGL